MPRPLPLKINILLFKVMTKPSFIVQTICLSAYIAAYNVNGFYKFMSDRYTIYVYSYVYIYHCLFLLLVLLQLLDSFPEQLYIWQSAHAFQLIIAVPNLKS